MDSQASASIFLRMSSRRAWRRSRWRSDLDEREFDVLVERAEAHRVEVGLLGAHEPQGDVRVLGGVGRRLLERDLVEALLLLADADEVGDRDAGVLEEGEGEVVERVAGAGGVDEVAGDHGVAAGPGPTA
jgi:hypothetical protein